MSNWMALGVYRSQEVLYKMKLAKSDICAACPMNVVGSLPHYLLYCPFTEEIRQKFAPQFIMNNPRIAGITNNEAALIVSILDPESALLPDDVRFNWNSSNTIYKLSRDYVYNVHKKFEKFYENYNK